MSRREAPELRLEFFDKEVDQYSNLRGTPALKRFTIADEQVLEHDIGNQRKWNELMMSVQDIVQAGRQKPRLSGAFRW